MRSVRLLVALCLASCAAAALGGTAGQVMFAYGETHALRQGHIVKLNAGSTVESGDQIHTGVDSYLQLRFTDWGVMSLRPRTDFVIDEYAYEPRVGGLERAFFSLLNGGVRSLTGLIGHRDRGNYRLRTTMSSIGIRGTHYSVLICKQDCKLEDGSLGEDGVYGGVIEGRIAVSPYGGAALEREFGAGEYFRLESASAVPELFFAPPPFFWDRREPQARSGGRTFAGIPWKPDPVTARAPSDTSSPVAVSDPAGIVAPITLSPTPAPALSPIATPVLTQTGSQLGATVGNLTAPLAPVIGSTVGALTPSLTPVTATLGSTVGAVATPVVAPIATLAPTVGAVVNPVVAPVVAPIAPVVAPVLAPIAPVVAPVTPVIAPVVAPIAPVIAPVVSPVAPVIAPVAPVVTPVVAPPPAVALPTVPSLTPVIGGLLPKK